MRQVQAAESAFDDLLHEYGQICAEQERLRQETTRRLVELEARASQLKAKLAAARGETAPQLSKEAEASNVVPVMPKTQPKRSYADHSDHPFPQKVGNVAKWATSQNPPVPISTARSWYSDDPKVGRPIPVHYYQLLKKEHGIPKSAWKNGVTTRTRKRPVPAGGGAAPV